MRKLSYPKNIILGISLGLGMVVCAFAQDSALNHGYTTAKDVSENKKNTAILEDVPILSYLQEDQSKLTGPQQQARSYRDEGIRLQRIGKLDEAMAFYQKAIEVDPAYAVAYNDLGIIYEANGQLDRAEGVYLKAVKIDPNYLSAYANLAIFYENKRDLVKAESYWKKRAEWGLPGDPWTARAKRRLADIRLVLGESSAETKEQELIRFMDDVASKKEAIKEQEYVEPKATSKSAKPKKATVKLDVRIERAKNLFWDAQLAYKRKDYEVALKDAFNALTLDPSNEVIAEFVDKLQARLLSR